MSTASAPAAPAGGAPASNGASAPAAAARPAPATAPKPSARSTDGRFSPKDGAVGVVAEETPAAEVKETAAQEARRHRYQLKVRGGEELFEGSDDDVKREIQVGRARAREAAELRQKLQDRDADDKLFDTDLEAYLRKRGKDPDEFAKARIGKLIETEAMSEEQRAAATVTRERDEALSKLKAREDADKKLQHEMRAKQARKQRIEKYASALKATGLPLESDAEKREMIYRMAQTEALVRDEQGHHDFTPEELAQETVRRAKQDGKHYLDSLSVPALLAELGPQRVQALLEHTVAEFEKASGRGSSPETQREEAPLEEGATREYIDEREADRRLREMTRTRR